MKLWIKAIRAPFFTASLVPVCVGVAWASFLVDINWLHAVLTLFGVIALQAGANLSNDYYDHRSGNDEANKQFNPFSGGSRFIQDGILTPRTVLAAAAIAYAIGLGIGIYLELVWGKGIIIALGAIGAAFGFFYSAGPIKLSYRGIGEIFLALLFGPLITLGAVYVQTGVLMWGAFWIGIPIALLITAVLYINQFPDYAADKSAGKKNLVVMLGQKRAVPIYWILEFGAYASMLALWLANIVPITILVAFVTIPLAIKASLTLSKKFDKFPDVLPANATTIMNHLFTGLLLALGIVLGHWINL